MIKIVNKDRYKIDKSLTEKQFFALSELKRHNKMELKNLSTQLHVSTSSLCILLNKLVEKKYVYREEDKRDRRNTFYGITKEGLEVFDEQVMKFVDVIDEKIDKLSKKIEQYTTDEYLVSVVAKHYDILKYLRFDKDNKSMKADYKYENRTRTEGKNKKKNPRKYVATAIEAMIGAIYMEENGNNIKKISDLSTKCWINFN